jgi:hypothetical protein
VSLAWNASKDSSGIASYSICCANVSAQVVSGASVSENRSPGRWAGAFAHPE